MKRKFFLNVPTGDMLSTAIKICGFVMAALLVQIGYIHEKTAVFAIAAVAVVIFAIFVCRHVDSMGLYIDGTDVCYKGMRRKEINIHDIAGVKVLQAYGASGYKGIYPIKESNGDKRYSAIFISELQDGMQSYSRGDLWFNQEYREFVICTVLYDKNAIDYLKSINPDIEVMY